MTISQRDPADAVDGARIRRTTKPDFPPFTIHVRDEGDLNLVPEDGGIIPQMTAQDLLDALKRGQYYVTDGNGDLFSHLRDLAAATEGADA